jgi:hypothetical protein
MPQLTNGSTTLPLPAASFSWFDTWKMALNESDATTYRMIANDPNASLKRVMVWLVGGSLIGMTISIVAAYLLAEGERPIVAASLLPVALALAVAIDAFVNVIAFGAAFVVMHLLARWMGSRATFLQLAYTSASFSAPLIVVSGIVGVVEQLLPPIQYAIFLITIAWVSLQYKVLTSVNQLSTGKAILTLVAGTAVQLIILLPIMLG